MAAVSGSGEESAPEEGPAPAEEIQEQAASLEAMMARILQECSTHRHWPLDLTAQPASAADRHSQ